MDLPVDAWALVRQRMTFRDWGKASGTSRASNAMKRHIVVADLDREQPARSRVRIAEQVCMEQQRLDLWPRCHSLWISLCFLFDTELAQSQINQIKKASEALPLLHGLHIIGRSYPYVATRSSSEAVFINSLARHASVLTLKVLPKVLTMAFDLPSLQHLVLELEAFHTTPSHTSQGFRQTHGNHLAAVCGLTNMKTLYVHYHTFEIGPIRICGTVDMTAYVQLQHVTLRNVIFEGSLVLTACMQLQRVTLHDVSFEGKLVLPEECPVHVINERRFLRDNIGACADLITGLTLHNAPYWEGHPCYRYRFCPPDIYRLLQHARHMQNLKRLQVKLGKRDFCNRNLLRHNEEVPLTIESLPSLEVLKIEMDGNLWVCMEFAQALPSLVIIATGTLRLARGHSCLEKEALPAPKQLYLRSGAALPCNHRGEVHQPYVAGIRLMDHIKLGQDNWTAQIPSTFKPANLNQCRCGACPTCLVQAGVPILCEEAWTVDGFQANVMGMSDFYRNDWLSYHGKRAA